MFTWKTPTEKSGLEKAIDEILSQMDQCISVDSDDYALMSIQLEKLYKLREIDDKRQSERLPSADTLALIAGNILGVILIVAYEKENVMNSKALMFWRKL